MKIRIGRDRLQLLGYFVGTILVGSALLSLPSAWTGQGRLSYIDALFTATSAVCVTGLITVNTAEYSRFGQTVIMALIQAGGLGIITFATLYLALPRRKISVVSRGVISDYSLVEVEYQPKSIIKLILGFTFAIEVTGMLLLNLRFGPMGQPFFVSAFHAVSAFCNAGFSTFPDNLEGFVLDPLVNFTIMGLIVSGGIGFLVMRDIGKRLSHQKTHLSYHSSIVLKTTAGLLIAGTVAFLGLEYDGAMKDMNIWQKLMASMFQSVTPRTAGFDTILQSNFGPGSQLLTILLMFIGASPASTGGGVKTTTFFILLMAAFRYREGTDYLNYKGRSIGGHSVYKAVGIVVKGVLVVLFAVIAITISESGRGNDFSIMEVAFETVSAFATVGLSLGITPELGEFSKTVLILTMFIGRVGLFAMALPRPGKKIEGYASMPGVELLLG